MTSAIFLTSGDIVVDRRYEWARDLEDKGDLAGAASLLTQALELAPHFASAWFALGELRETLGDCEAAAAAFRSAALADPPDRHGAALRLARLGALPPVAMPVGYIRTLFDGYAPAFEASLRGGLGYCAPEQLLAAVEQACAGGTLKFSAALDLGCGTGLAGAAFRPCCDRLAGVDLSPAMLARARAKGQYDELVEAEAMTFLHRQVAAGARYDLILAADVFIYFHELLQVSPPVKQLLSPGGLFTFSVETHDGEGVILRDTLRYAHGKAHVRAALAASGLTLVSLDSAASRSEKGVAVPGLIVVARN
jgi:predicted TPR repeat methyltransferase